jgi:hypothetical protein
MSSGDWMAIVIGVGVFLVLSLVAKPAKKILWNFLSEAVPAAMLLGLFLILCLSFLAAVKWAFGVR